MILRSRALPMSHLLSKGRLLRTFLQKKKITWQPRDHIFSPVLILRRRALPMSHLLSKGRLLVFFMKKIILQPRDHIFGPVLMIHTISNFDKKTHYRKGAHQGCSSVFQRSFADSKYKRSNCTNCAF